MATGSIITIANRALGSISARSNIQSLQEGSTESNAVNLYFQSTFEALARTAKWNCLKKQAALSLVSSAPGTPTNPNGTITPYPDNPWLYSYLTPSDSLFIRQLIPPRPVLQNQNGVPVFPTNNFVGTWNGTRRRIPYAVSYGLDTLGNAAEVINTNLGGALAEYTVNQSNPAFWDSLFQQTMVASLAVFLSSSVSGDKALTQLQLRAAEGFIMQARAADGNESVVSQDREASWIAARVGESGPWSLGFNTSYLNYSAMPWPVF